MTDIVIATAGHIDHGKSTLVKALTGIETDTTKEEKSRGLTINLGFAYLDLPNGQRVGIVDVPGHEKFIKNMVAGLPGISMVLLVIDAQEGVMPQTKEHVEILTLLGIRNFIIVLTKVEAIDEELKELVKEDICDQFADTPLENAPIIETDAVAGIGLDQLIQTIQDMAKDAQSSSKNGIARLNVDRSFSVKGFGTVVTGTLLDGPVKVGDELTILPGDKTAKVRTIQVHEVNQESSTPGQRTALNLAGISKDEISRGDVLVGTGGRLEPSWMLDVKINYLKSAVHPLTLWDRVRLLIGTKEVFARVVPIGSEQIAAGEDGFVQLRLEEQLAVKTEDRFIVRSYSPMVTIGGGQVLDPHPAKHRRFKQDVLDSLKVKDEGSLDHLILDFIGNQKNILTTLEEISVYTGTPQEQLLSAIDELIDGDELYPVPPQAWISKERFQQFSDELAGFVQAYHKKFRLKKGMPIDEIRSKYKNDLSSKPLDYLLDLMQEQRTIVRQDSLVALSDFEVVYNDYQKKAKAEIEKVLGTAGLTPVKPEELASLDKNAGEVLEAMGEESVIFLSREAVVSRKYFDEAVETLKQYLAQHQKITLADFRDATGTSRKTALLLLEFMDKNGITKRLGDARALA